MTRQETVVIITLLAGNYEGFSKKTETDQQVKLIVDTWQELLGDLDYQVVLQAVKRAMINSPYPPTIHEIRKNAIEMINPTKQVEPIVAWNEAYEMICNGSYMTAEEFEKHSPEVKRFFGSVRQVKELAQTDLDTVNTVTKGQFLKQYENMIQREKAEKMLPPQMQEIAKQLTERMSIEQIGDGYVR